MHPSHVLKAALGLAALVGVTACQQRQEEATAPPAADVNVTTPAPVNVTPPADVDVNPPDVNINPPDVNINPPQVNVPGPSTTTTEKSTTVTVPGVGSSTTTTVEKK